MSSGARYHRVTTCPVKNLFKLNDKESHKGLLSFWVLASPGSSRKALAPY